MIPVSYKKIKDHKHHKTKVLPNSVSLTNFNEKTSRLFHYLICPLFSDVSEAIESTLGDFLIFVLMHLISVKVCLQNDAYIEYRNGSSWSDFKKIN